MFFLSKNLGLVQIIYASYVSIVRIISCTVHLPWRQPSGDNILVGRPFGSLATLIHHRHKDFIKNHVCSERYSIISVDSLVLVNVYLPTQYCSEDVFLVDEILTAIL